MNTKTFLELVLGDNGLYCIWANRLSDSKIVQKFYPTIDALLHAAHNFDSEGFDSYFALSTFGESGTRQAWDVVQLRSFFLDLDCGDRKKYPSQVEALSALRDFCKNTKLPRPTLVNSGRGIHVYWALTTPVTREVWLPVATKLKNLCVSNGLHIDASVTADAARVLRVPGTRNHKDKPPKDVDIVGNLAPAVEFSDFAALLGCSTEQEVIDNTLLGSHRVPVDGPDLMMQALAGNITARFKTIVLKTVDGSGCAQIGNAITDQESVSEPLWRATLSIARFCVDGDKAIHKVSNKHSEYSYDKTEEKAALIKGPYLCDKFNEYNMGVCQKCPHWGKIKSPIVLGREIDEATDEDNVVVAKSNTAENGGVSTYVIPKYPAPFFRGKDGGVYKRGKQVKDENGDLDEEASKDKLVYFNDIYVVRRLRDPEQGEALVMRLHLPRDGVREFMVPLTAVGSKDEFRKHLATHGVAVLNVSDLMEYTMRWVNELQFKSEADEAFRQFGWMDDSGTVFALGSRLIYKDRVEINAPSNATVGLFPFFQPKGNLDGWKQTMEFYDRPGMEAHQFMVGIAFGSALMEFQPINAAAFHMYSKESGLGKTTGMLAGASIWGNPDLLMMQERDTFNSKMNRAEVYKNLPCYMDELTNTKPQDLSDFAYQLPSGLQRNRMGIKGNIERVRGKPWKTLFGTTGNTSMIERISTYKSLPKAEAQRILEFRVSRMEFADKNETDEFSTAVKHNYGVAAVPFLQYVINNLVEVKDAIAVTQRKLDRLAELSAENRFWSALAACTVTGLMVARKAGLINWKIAPIVAWVVEVMKNAKTSVEEMSTDIESILTDYLAEHYSSLLRIKSTDVYSPTSTGLDHLVIPEAVPRGNSFIARYEYDIKRLFLLPKPFRAWCTAQQLNFGGIMEGLKSGRTKATQYKVNMTEGINMYMPPATAIVIDCKGFMSDETEKQLAATATILQESDPSN